MVLFIVAFHSLQIIRIILIIPVYALCSALSLLLDEYSIYINTVRDVYEAYCIHCFLALMLDYPGGEHAVVNGIRELPLLKHPFPLCFLPRMRLGVDFIINMKRTTLQFVVLKPLMAIISIILMLAGQFDTIWWQVSVHRHSCCFIRSVHEQNMILM